MYGQAQPIGKAALAAELAVPVLAVGSENAPGRSSGESGFREVLGLKKNGSFRRRKIRIPPRHLESNGEDS